MPGQHLHGVAFSLDVALQDRVGIADAEGRTIEGHRRTGDFETGVRVDTLVRYYAREIGGRCQAESVRIVGALTLGEDPARRAVRVGTIDMGEGVGIVGDGLLEAAFGIAVVVTLSLALSLTLAVVARQYDAPQHGVGGSALTHRTLFPGGDGQQLVVTRHRLADTLDQQAGAAGDLGVVEIEVVGTEIPHRRGIDRRIELIGTPVDLRLI